MKLYDEIITKILALTKECSRVNLPVGSFDWPVVSDRRMILRSDMAYELGSELNAGAGCTLVTANEALVCEDELVLIGPDLPEITEDGCYGRLALVQVDEAVMGEGQALYSAIRTLEFTKYHFYPEGFMNRISSGRHRESVRVGRQALKDGLNFTVVGNQLIRQFKENKTVKHVRLIYITDPGFDFKTFRKLTLDSEDITKTIDHIYNNVLMDCKACDLQKVCDEVEGLKELHFGSRRS